MLNIEASDQLYSEFLKNVKDIMNENNTDIKKFKLEQAENFKNMIINSDSTLNLAQEFSKYQMELKNKEKSQQRSIESALDEQFKKYTDKLYLVLKNLPIASDISGEDDDTTPKIINGQDVEVISNTSLTADDIINDLEEVEKEEELSSDKFIDKAISESFSNINSDETEDEALQKKKDKDIPIDTKELDDWLAEIKDLI